jgi:HAD superfamily hydrolase (TIGR01509 family)
MAAEWPERFFSFEHGRLKRDDHSFTWLAEQLSAPPSQCLLIDDSSVNVRNAELAGWQTIQFQNALQLRDELRAKGLLSEG